MPSLQREWDCWEGKCEGASPERVAGGCGGDGVSGGRAGGTD